MSNGIQGVGCVMVCIGIFIMISSLQEAMIVFYQALILGAMFFGLGIVVYSVVILNNSIKKQTEFFIDRFDKKEEKEVNSEGYEKLD
jgi:predicted membrane channel-forming protein YqfA (hemolysin III family)